MNLVLPVLLLLAPKFFAVEVEITSPCGLKLGAVPVAGVFLDRVEVSFASDCRRAAVTVRDGRNGGSMLYFLEKDGKVEKIARTSPEETLSDPLIIDPEGTIAVVLRSPARLLTDEKQLRQGGGLLLCNRSGCREIGNFTDLWRPVAFEGNGHLLAARILPGDMIDLEAVKIDLERGVFLPTDKPKGVQLRAPEPWPSFKTPAPLPPPEQQLSMPYIHQVYDTPNEFNGHWACGPTSTLMAIQHWSRLEKWPITVDVPYSHTSDYGAYVSRVYTAYGTTFNRYQDDASGNPAAGAYGWCTDGGAAWAWRMQDYAKRHQLLSDFDGSSTFGEVQSALDQGRVVVLSTGLTSAGHIITVKGYTSDGRLITNDPYGDKNRGYMNYYGEGAVYTWAQVDSPWFITVYSDQPAEIDDAEFVSETVPDGTHFLPGEKFVKSWTLRNTGNTTWTREGNYLLAFDSGERFSAPDQTLLESGAVVAPGATYQWNVEMTAPGQPGTYRGYWIMDRYGVHRFGDRVWVEIVVDQPPQPDGQDGGQEPGDTFTDGGNDEQPPDTGGLEEDVSLDATDSFADLMDAGPGQDQEADGDWPPAVSGGCSCQSAPSTLLALPFFVLLLTGIFARRSRG